MTEAAAGIVHCYNLSHNPRPLGARQEDMCVEEAVSPRIQLESALVAADMLTVPSSAAGGVNLRSGLVGLVRSVETPSPKVWK